MTRPEILANLPARDAFEGTIDGKVVGLYVLQTESMAAAFTNYGARIVSIVHPDKRGAAKDVVLGLPGISAYCAAHEPFFGPIVGPVANRIGGASFVLDGRTYATEANHGRSTLHGGTSGFHSQVWNALEVGARSITFELRRRDGQGGFSGNLRVRVTYSLEIDALCIRYDAETDMPTPFGPTSHAIFNLNGDDSGTIDLHTLRIAGDRYLPVDAELIPLGTVVAVDGTPFDFRHPAPIGARLEAFPANDQLGFARGFDHAWILEPPSGDGLREAAVLFCEKSGIRMDVLTTEPALQFYSGNYFSGADVGKSGKPIHRREGLALEAQHYPDSVNRPAFPSMVLRPGRRFASETIYRFSLGGA